MEFSKENITGLNPVDFCAEVGGKTTEFFVLRNKAGMEVCICNFGALILSVMVPDRNGRMENVVIGCDNIGDAMKLSKEYYIGATIGPVAGRIINGKIRVGGKDYQLPVNSAPNTLHSGEHGFHTVVWDARQTDESTIELTYDYRDGEAGFPGNITARMIYHVSDSNELRIDYSAESDREAIYAPTNHAYFNLSGVGTPTPSIEDHLVRINSRLYLPTDENTNHTGEILSVEGSPFDFREFHAIGERIGENHHQLVCGHGYDHCFVIDKKRLKELEYAATCISPGSGRRMDIYTTEPGMIMYTGNYLSGLHGMHGTTYPRRSAVCFETECYPDTPANLHFPSIVLRKGDIYTQTCIYKFSIQS
ncbi:MAG: galactose mutarotase [Muribaculaceae bacterium]|nr:galactose mutarotase [Muribaculaceae bacterium]